MKNLAIARRYAKALLLIAKDDGNADQYRQELDTLDTLMSENGQFTSAVNNPLYEPSGRKAILNEVINRLKLSEPVKAFLKLLFDKGRFGFFQEINANYQKLVDDLKGVARASVTSATQLAPETLDRIQQTLARKTGKQIILEVNEDPGLIGGVVTRIGDLVLDGSIKTQLLNMRESLKRGEIV